MPATKKITAQQLDDIELAYRNYGAQCYSLARRIVRDPLLAQDVVQDVFASLLRRPDRFDPDRGAITTWLMTLTHHKAVDLVRGRQSRTGLDTTDEVLGWLPDLMPGPEDAACSTEQAANVHGALQRLSDSEREVIVWAYFGGYSQSEIARHLDVPLGTVKSRTVRGLHQLAEHLRTSEG